MDTLSASTLWWLAAGLLVAAELVTGTVYLLMLAVGAGCGALAAHAGLGIVPQCVIAAVAGALATTLWRRRRARQVVPPAACNPDVNLDIGQTVQVDAWRTDRSATVQYRGAAWQASWSGDGVPASGPHRIAAVDGNCLVLAR